MSAKEGCLAFFFPLTFQSPLQHDVIWGPLLSYQYKFLCIETILQYILTPPSPPFSFFFFSFFFLPNESAADLAADISIHFTVPE